MRYLWIFFYYTTLLVFKIINFWCLITSTLPFTFKNLYFRKFCLMIDAWLFFIQRWRLNYLLCIVLLRRFRFYIRRRLFFRCGDIFIYRWWFFFLFSLEVEFRLTDCLWDSSMRIHPKLKNLTTLRVIDMFKRIWKLNLLRNTIFLIILYLSLWI